MKFTQFEISEYVCGWLTSEMGENKMWFDMEDVEGAICNAKAMVNDDHDGIEAMVKRKARTHVELFDFYWSETAEKRCSEVFCGTPNTVKWFKKQRYVEMIAHRGKPLMSDDDLTFLGTGTYDDIKIEHK
jgi:predicted metal-dependent phosphoesterase TrpH